MDKPLPVSSAFVEFDNGMEGEGFWAYIRMAGVPEEVVTELAGRYMRRDEKPLKSVGVYLEEGDKGRTDFAFPDWRETLSEFGSEPKSGSDDGVEEATDTKAEADPDASSDTEPEPPSWKEYFGVGTAEPYQTPPWRRESLKTYLLNCRPKNPPQTQRDPRIARMEMVHKLAKRVNAERLAEAQKMGLGPGKTGKWTRIDRSVAGGRKGKGKPIVWEGLPPSPS